MRLSTAATVTATADASPQSLIRVRSGAATLPLVVDIAAVSVVSSGLVALGTIVANFIGGERQRTHELSLDFEKRVWERKSDALFGVIDECRALLDALADADVDESNKVSWALYLSKTRDALRDVRPTVEALASTECRHALASLIVAIDQQGVRENLGRRVARYKNEMFELDPPKTAGETLIAQLDPISQSIKRYQRYRDWIEEAEQEAVADFRPDLSSLNPRAERLLEAARESVRHPKD